MTKYLEQTEKLKEDLFLRVNLFMVANRITCEEAVYQCDWVIENAYSFIADLYNIMQPNLPEPDLWD